MRCETFLSPVQTFLCGGPSIEPCGHPLLIANSLLARVRKGEQALLYFQVWGDPDNPALKESELVSTFNGWLALEERIWQTTRVWEAGKSANELGC
jgi:hypothetical protein